jgi:hypothetical protein
MLTCAASSSRETNLEPHPFHKQVCPAGTPCTGGCVKYSEGVYAGSCIGLLNAEGRELVSDGEARVERVGEGPA